MRTVRSNPLTRAASRMHRLIYGRFGGRLGTRIGPHPVLLLTTRGRRSGAERTVPLSYVDTNAGPVVIGSYAGEPRDPAWALNLRAQPDAEMRIGRQIHRVRAVELHGPDREAAAQEFEAIDASYRVYRQRTDRVLPVFPARAHIAIGAARRTHRHLSHGAERSEALRRVIAEPEQGSAEPAILRHRR